MESHPSFENLLLLIFAVVSFLICTTQNFLRKKIKFLTLCKVSIFIPLLSIFIWATSETSDALHDLSAAGDLTAPVVHVGASNFLASISVGL